MRKRNLFVLSIITGLLLTSLLSFGTNAVLAGGTIVTYNDDFSVDSGLWQYVGSAYRDSTNQYLVLTEPIKNQAGVAFFKLPVSTTFTATFNYKVGGGSGADGFTLFFYKQKYSSPSDGGYLGFNPIGGVAPGYGIEFDCYQNAENSANHIALIEDHVSNHLISVDDARTEDNEWHRVTVTVDESSVTVVVDEAQVFQWNGIINRTFDCLGFSGATGSLTNKHIIDNFSIETDPPITQVVPEVPFGAVVASSSLIAAVLVYITLTKRGMEPKLQK